LEKNDDISSDNEPPFEYLSIKMMTRRRQVNRQGSGGPQCRRASADADLAG
jgi:hypothetical protein